MYAQNIAVNHFLATVGITPTKDMVTRKLDSQGARFNPRDTTQAHLMQLKRNHPLSDLLGRFGALLGAMLDNDRGAIAAQCDWFESDANRDRTAGGPLARGPDFDDWSAAHPPGNQ